MSGINQKEYLKKYLGIGKGSGEKKKKKKPKKTLNGLKIVDDDIDINLNEEIKQDLTADNEEAPQIVSIIDDRPPSLRIDEVTHDKLWKPIGAPETLSSSDTNLKFEGSIKLSRQMESLKRYSASKLPSSPATSKNKLKHHKGNDFSPPRRKETNYGSGSDSSPPRKKINKDNSPPRRGRTQDDDYSPPRRNRREKSEDCSPPRKKKIPDNDSSPPRRIKREKSEDSSPPRRGKTHDNDFSPPRRNRREKSEDCSPPRKKKIPDNDSLPPRRIKREKSEDNSPPRRNRREKSEDCSPPRKKKIPDNDSWPSRRIKREKSEDISPPRRSKNYDIKASPPSKSKAKKSRWGDFEEPDLDKLTKTLDGKKAGLQNAADLVVETRELKTREDELFRNMSAAVSGSNAATIVRGKKKEIDWEEEERKKKQEAANKEKYDRWGKGLKQVEDSNEKMKNELYEMSKPLARYADDEDLEKYLKDQEREGDPMLAYIKQKKKKKVVEEGKPTVQQYQGDAPPNRFGIRPGYRWDGVDRSTGYEKEWFQVQNSRMASLEETYKWSTEDM